MKRSTVKSSGKSKSGKDAVSGGDVAAYSTAQSPAFGSMCETLRGLIEKALPKATSKVWHGSPVWFIEDNPVVGYNATAKGVNLLFWNGQALDDPDLKPVGKYGAAQAVFRDAGEFDPAVIRRWLKKAKADVFDSKTFFKRLREAR